VTVVVGWGTGGGVAVGLVHAVVFVPPLLLLVAVVVVVSFGHMTNT